MSKDTVDKTGASLYGGGKKMPLSEITFNGDKGEFYYRDKDAVKDEETGKYPKKDLGKSIDIVVLKIRRKLAVYKKSGGMSTNEHNHKGDLVVLYGIQPRDKGTAEQIRARHEELRTQQILYAFYAPKKEVVRVVVKGASLGSEAKHPKEVKKFYDYLQTFSKAEPLHSYFTKLVPIEEEGPKGTYFAAVFERGAKLSEDQQGKIDTLIDEIHADIEEQDAAFKERNGGDMPMDHAGEEDEIQMGGDEDPLEKEFASTDKKVQYPDEEINPEDIPF